MQLWKSLGVFAVGAALISTVVGAAASLTLSGSSSVGANDAAAASCDTDGVTTAYTTTYDSSIPGYKVATVTIGDLADSTCTDNVLAITLTDASNTSLGTATATLASTDITAGTKAFSSFGAAVNAENMTKIFVSLSK